MPSKLRPIQFRAPWLRKSKGDRADLLAKALLEHPSIQNALSNDRCPVCGKPFDECDYFKSLDEE